MEQKVHQVLSVSLMQDGTTCMDVAMEVDGKPEIWHIPGGPVTVEEQEEPIDLAQKAAEKGNPWFGMGNLLTGNIAESAGGTLTLADIDAMFDTLKSQPIEPAVEIVSPWYAANRERLMRLWHNQSERRLAAHYRALRWKKIRKRQRRAAQRRHARGEQ